MLFRSPLRNTQRLLESSAILIIQVVTVVDDHQLDLAAFRHVDRLVENETSAMDLGFQHRRRDRISHCRRPINRAAGLVVETMARLSPAVRAPLRIHLANRMFPSTNARIENPRVPGSIPGPSTLFVMMSARCLRLFALRQSAARAAMDRFRAFLDEQHSRHPPKSPIGTALSYALDQWDTLTPFIDDVKIPLDNNASERALRVVALGRKNFLFVGDPEHGENLAGLYSLVSTCDANDVDPIAYLKDVLIRVDEHRASQIDDLLPHR